MLTRDRGVAYTAALLHTVRLVDVLGYSQIEVPSHLEPATQQYTQRKTRETCIYPQNSETKQVELRG